MITQVCVINSSFLRWASGAVRLSVISLVLPTALCRQVHICKPEARGDSCIKSYVLHFWQFAESQSASVKAIQNTVQVCHLDFHCSVWANDCLTAWANDCLTAWANDCLTAWANDCLTAWANDCLTAWANDCCLNTVQVCQSDFCWVLCILWMMNKASTEPLNLYICMLYFTRQIPPSRLKWATISCKHWITLLPLTKSRLALKYLFCLQRSFHFLLFCDWV